MRDSQPPNYQERFADTSILADSRGSRCIRAGVQVRWKCRRRWWGVRKTPVTLVVGFALGAFAWAADSTLQLAPTSLNLMPAPQRISLQSGKFRLAESFAVSIAGIRE